MNYAEIIQLCEVAERSTHVVVKTHIDKAIAVLVNGIAESDLRTVYESEGKISAIRAYKNNTGCRLVTAKNAIEEYAREGNWRKPA